MKEKIKLIPTLIALFSAIGLLVPALFRSASPQIFIYSYFRFAVIIIIISISLYFLFSLRSRRLISFNNWAAYTLVGAALVVEIGMRLFPSIIPTPLVQFLPQGALFEIAGQRGFMTDELITGEGLLYHYRPNIALPAMPWVRIDSRGYRNPVEPESEADVVFLGDSVTIAQDARKDFADRFRENGLSALNLAQGGYGPYQYRDVYRKLVIEPGLKHRYLVVVVVGRNDFEDALNYARVSEKGGDYHAYLGETAQFAFGNIQSPYFPWVIAIAGNVVPIVKDALSGRRGGVSGVVRLPYGDVPATHNILRLDPVGEKDLTWMHFKKAMDEILDMARRQGVKVLVAYHPPSRLTYMPFLEGYEEHKAQLLENHRNLMAMMAAYLDRPGVRFVDLTRLQQTAAGREDIAAFPLNVHLNTRGIALVAERLLDELRQMED